MTYYRIVKKWTVVACLFATLLLVGCEGPVGPAGPVGAMGAQGGQGQPGDSFSDLTEDFETGNFSANPWQFGGSAAWVVVTNASAPSGVKRIGTRVAASGNIVDNQRSSLSISFNQEQTGLLSFNIRISSEMMFDWLYLKLDGVTLDGVSGQNNTWFTMNFVVPAGQHTLEWSYEKDSSVSVGEDRALVDNIGITNQSPNKQGAPVNSPLPEGVMRWSERVPSTK